MRGLVMRGDVLGLERRRRWRDEDKIRIVSSVGVGGVTVTQLAHHHEITRQQIYAWRHDLKKKGLLAPSGGMAFLPVDLSILQNASAGTGVPAASPLVEVRLQNGRSLHFEGTLDAAILARLIQVVETA
jgi:transposase